MNGGIDLEQRKKTIQEKMLKIKNKIIVMSGKGGVGKTTNSLHIGYQLKKKHGLTFQYIDADVQESGTNHCASRENLLADCGIVIKDENDSSVEVKEEESAILIYPGTVKPGIVSTYDDHRMAMAFALLGIRAEGIVIDNCECCRKTFEDYFKVLDRVLA